MKEKTENLLQKKRQNRLNFYKIRKNNNIISLLSLLFLLVIVCFVTIIYSSYNAEMIITGEAILRVEENIRVTDIKVIEQTNSAYETYNNKYDKERTSMFVTLPNINSSITYQVTITNNSNTSYDVSDIVIENYSNTSIKYDIDLSVGNVIEANTSKTFTIRFYYDNTTLPNDVTNTLIIKYDFVEHIDSYVVDTYDYTGNYETFIAPYDGVYKIELWGAGGGPNDIETMLHGGYGAYVSGEITLNKGISLYLYVGNYGYKPANLLKPFNGGGAPDTTGTWAASHTGDYSGGGATDIRITGGNWDNFDSLKSRIMVAAGGAAGNNIDGTYGGAGGGITGLKVHGSIEVPTQVKGFAFGIGQDSGVYPTSYTGSDGVAVTIGADTGAGGGGYYGGYRGYNHNSGGSSGSSFISGHNGCNAVAANSTSTNIIHTGQSVHYSGYKFTNTKMIDGDGYNWTTVRGSYVGMPSHDGTSTITGNIGNGYAKITFIKRTYN